MFGLICQIISPFSPKVLMTTDHSSLGLICRTPVGQNWQRTNDETSTIAQTHFNLISIQSASTLASWLVFQENSKHIFPEAGCHSERQFRKKCQVASSWMIQMTVHLTYILWLQLGSSPQFILVNIIGVERTSPSSAYLPNSWFIGRLRGKQQVVNHRRLT